MRIAVNGRFLLKDKLEGLGRFSHEVIQRLARSHPEHEFVVFFDRAYDASFLYSSNIIPVSVFPQARHPYLYYLWFEWSLPRQFRRWKPDLFLSPDGFLSLSADLPQLPVIHDISFEHYPQYISKTGSRFYRRNFPLFAKKAARIATVSEYSKQDIASCYGIAPEKIDVVYNGSSETFHPLDADGVEAFRKTLFNGRPWFVYVGSLHPRKNVELLLKAFDAFKENDPDGYQLVIIGRKAWQTTSMEETFNSMKHKDSVRFTGWISDEAMLPFLCGARSLVYVPVFEGFGLPLLEAFSCHIPAITSNITSLPEVAGNAALCVDPFSVAEISNAMTRMAREDGLHAQLAKEAQKRALDFSWDDTASRLWQTAEKVIFERA